MASSRLFSPSAALDHARSRRPVDACERRFTAAKEAALLRHGRDKQGKWNFPLSNERSENRRVFGFGGGRWRGRQRAAAAAGIQSTRPPPPVSEEDIIQPRDAGSRR